jgi:small subunit ribosomal protein S12
MTTVSQIVRGKVNKKIRRKRVSLGTPQKKGMCLKVYTRKPKKPNSAQRKVAKVRLSNKMTAEVYIMGEGHTLKEHSTVLVRGGRTPDLPGVNFKCIRGKFDLLGVVNRRTSRSKYGVKKLKNF